MAEEATFRTIIEPFRIHSVEPLRMTSEAERRAAVVEAGYNLFGLKATDVLIDLLTDSGTGAMSPRSVGQRYNVVTSHTLAHRHGSFSATRVQELFPYTHVIPTHQGRAAERILFSGDWGARQGGTEQHPFRHHPGQRGRQLVRKRSISVIAEGKDPFGAIRSRETWT